MSDRRKEVLDYHEHRRPGKVGVVPAQAVVPRHLQADTAFDALKLRWIHPFRRLWGAPTC